MAGGLAPKEQKALDEAREMEALVSALASPGGMIIRRVLEEMYWRAFQDFQNTSDSREELQSKLEMKVIEKLMASLGAKIDFGEAAKRRVRKALGYKET